MITRLHAEPKRVNIAILYMSTSALRSLENDIALNEFLKRPPSKRYNGGCF